MIAERSSHGKPGGIHNSSEARDDKIGVKLGPHARAGPCERCPLRSLLERHFHRGKRAFKPENSALIGAISCEIRILRGSDPGAVRCMLIVIQPNIVSADGKAGVQAGNLVVIEEKSARSLQRYPMEFIRVP